MDYAAADATIFAEYCRSTLGLPDDNVRYYPDATYLNMLDALTDIRNIARAYKGELDIIFYYAGHGLQDDATRAPHLMPVDADGTRPDHCLPTSKLYSELASTDARSITVFLDACFSGSQRGEGMISKARGVRLAYAPMLRKAAWLCSAPLRATKQPTLTARKDTDFSPTSC